MHTQALFPGALLGPYPERTAEPAAFFDAAITSAMRRVTCLPTLEKQRARHFVNAVEAFADECTSAEPGELLNRLRQVKKTLRRTGLDSALNDGTAAEAFALVRELAGRTLTRRHYPCQLMGGWLILNGMLAEMDTGEGKTLTATLPAAIAAMAGIPVHVITTSDYLARRDAENLAPLYRVLGLSVGVVTDDMQTPAERRAAYACDITYTTNKQIGFDYLRDRAGGHTRSRLDRLLQRCGETMQQPVLRGLCFGIVDEADSVLIDEATTPLILARAVKNSPAPEHYGVALACAARLQQGRDYTQHDRRIDLTPHGREYIEKLLSRLDAFWRRRDNREGLIEQALRAINLYVRDQHYLVIDGKVKIIDANTGRCLDGRTWERGLHQLIETREKVELTPVTEATDRISYQQLFSRYLRLGAMTGTAAEVAPELLTTYKLKVVRVDSHRPSRRTNLGTHVCADTETKLRAIVERVKQLHTSGQPVLIGTRSVASSEELSAHLTAAGLNHAVLNARHDAREAEIVARAGQRGQITIATNMAGRGTDIELGSGVAALGGLHVIVSSPNDARRLDRQLQGRCGRQGDPGSFETYISPDDEIVKHVKALKRCRVHHETRILCNAAVRLAQRNIERKQRFMRKRLARSEEQLGSALAFAAIR